MTTNNREARSEEQNKDLLKCVQAQEILGELIIRDTTLSLHLTIPNEGILRSLLNNFFGEMPVIERYNVVTSSSTQDLLEELNLRLPENISLCEGSGSPRGFFLRGPSNRWSLHGVKLNFVSDQVKESIQRSKSPVSSKKSSSRARIGLREKKVLLKIIKTHVPISTVSLHKKISKSFPKVSYGMLARLRRKEKI